METIFYTTIGDAILLKLIKKIINRNVYFSVNPKDDGRYEIGIRADLEQWLITTVRKLEG